MIQEPQTQNQEILDDPETDKCQTCGGPASDEPHTCPFAEEIYGDETPCNCCESCCYECAMDI